MRTRLIFGIIAACIFLGCMWLGPWWYSGLLFILAIIGMLEWNKINALNDSLLMQVISICGLALLVLPWSTLGVFVWLKPELLVWLLMLILLALTVLSNNRIPYTRVANLFMGIVYIGFGFHYMIYTAFMNEHGMYYALMIYLIIWSTDSGAYFIGSAMGKNKLIPSISPNKTIEGAVGGIVVAIVVALLLSRVAPETMPIAQAIVLGAVIGIFAELGDLIQSAYKRVIGVKDSGNFMPGHGGVLDRVDSWLIVFPIVIILGFVH